MAEAEVVIQAPGLYAKLAEVMGAVGRVEKRGRNTFHNYDYVTEADLVETVRSELSSRQIVMLPSVTKVDRDASVTTVHMTFTFIDGETGQKHIAGWSGTGEDPPVKGKDGKEPSMGDKGLYKAYTGAIKYFLMKSFLIPTGDDPERDEKPVEKAKPAPSKPKTPTLDRVQRAADLRQRIVDLNLVDDAKMVLTSFGVDRLEDMDGSHAEQLEAWLTKQGQDKAAA